MRIKFVRPASLHQRLKVKATIVEFESRLRVEYVITSEAGEVLTRGYTIQVAVDAQTMEMQYVCPPVLWECLGVSP
jgi:acyl-CoA thioester hydrolase